MTYVPTGNPATRSDGLSAVLRAEFNLIGDAFVGLPRITTAGLYDTILIQQGNYTFTLPPVDGATLATIADVAAEEARAIAVESTKAPIIAPTFNGTATFSGTINANGTVNLNGSTNITGTTTNDNATAGKVGQLISSNVASGSAITILSATPTNITSISLTAGDWDVWGTVGFIVTGATQLSAWISTTSAAVPTDTNGGAIQNLILQVGSFVNSIVSAGKIRLSLAATTTVYLSARTIPTDGTAYGFIGARRRR